jgi:hypothetical protein
MNLAELHDKLIAAARAHPPSDRVPFAFQKRVMAHLRSRGMPDAWALWSRALWRAAAPCVLVTLLLSAWVWFAPRNSPNADLTQDFENTVLAVADQDTSVEAN